MKPPTLPPSRRTFLGTTLALPVALSVPAVAEERHAGPPAILTMPSHPPEPETCLVAEMTWRGVTMSAIHRIWPAGQGHRCRLCPRDECSFDESDRSCLVMIAGRVEDKDALWCGTADQNQ